MFNSKNQATGKPKRPTPSRDAAVTILTSGCHFDGKLYCRGSSRIGGKIEGEIISEGLLIIEEGAVITASVHADEAVIQGSIKGKLQAKGRVELCASAKFEGDVMTPSLVIREGAQFNGTSKMVIEHTLIDTSSDEFKGNGADSGPGVDAIVDSEVAVLNVPSASA